MQNDSQTKFAFWNLSFAEEKQIKKKSHTFSPFSQIHHFNILSQLFTVHFFCNKHISLIIDLLCDCWFDLMYEPRHKICIWTEKQRFVAVHRKIQISTEQPYCIKMNDTNRVRFCWCEVREWICLDTRFGKCAAYACTKKASIWAVLLLSDGRWENSDEHNNVSSMRMRSIFQFESFHWRWKPNIEKEGEEGKGSLSSGVVRTPHCSSNNTHEWENRTAICIFHFGMYIRQLLLV